MPFVLLSLYSSTISKNNLIFNFMILTKKTFELRIIICYEPWQSGVGKCLAKKTEHGMVEASKLVYIYIYGVLDRNGKTNRLNKWTDKVTAKQLMLRSDLTWSRQKKIKTCSLAWTGQRTGINNVVWHGHGKKRRFIHGAWYVHGKNRRCKHWVCMVMV